MSTYGPFAIENIAGPTVEQDWQNENTRYWFNLEIDGEPAEYAIADTNGETDLLDADGNPLTEDDWETIYVLKALEPLYKKARDDA